MFKLFPKQLSYLFCQLRDIASGLAYLHSNHVIHADLKSVSRTFLTSMHYLQAFSFSLQQNILISPTGSPLIADFGLSLAISQSQSSMGTTSAFSKGTVRWMAIEQLPSPSLDGAVPVKPNKKTDVWSFGMVAYVRDYTQSSP